MGGVCVLKITKMHGLGNDFIMVMEQDVKGLDIVSFTKKVCERKLNVGADGVIIVCESDKADTRMRIINADGSEAEMCGNGIRCFAKFVYENGIVAKTDMTVETLAGIMTPKLILDGDKVASVTVDMGSAFLENEDIPVIKGVDAQNFDIEVLGEKINICAVLVGVPHAIVFTDDISDETASKFGPLIEKHDCFPKNANVDFVKVKDDKTLLIKTWERGAGLTLACGTGCCSAAVAANLRGYCGNEIEVKNTVGSLFIELKNNRVYMSGEAANVFCGELA